MSKSAINAGFPSPNYVVETTNKSAILPGLYLVESVVVTLSADHGSLTLSGQQAGFKTTLTAARGSFSLSGQAATFRGSLASSRGSYTLTGQDIGGLPFGSYALTGEPAAGRVTLAAAHGSYSLTGEPAGFRPALVAGHGAFALTGEAAALTLSGGQRQTAVTIICG